jgi:polar amino acid transport system substrate-binding protein
MKKIIALTLALCTIFMLAACGTKVENESDLAYVKDKGEMLVGITIFSPMNYYDENNELIGFETEFTKAVCEKLGVTPKFVEINWDSKEVELNAKNIDCIWNGMTITEERKANMSITIPYMDNKQVLIVKADKAEQFKTSLDGAKIVAEQGSTGEELALNHESFKNAKYTAVDAQAKGLVEVKSGVSDILIADYTLALGSVGEGTDFEDLAIIDSYTFDSQEYGIAFRKGSDMTEEVNKIMKELAADGTIKKIAEKYNLDKLLVLE